ncbi:MAG: hypothetical protein SPJ12_08105 [Duodenibacillus sp.]|nr:hypothetical protein [Duodenibacillus sp.]
MSATGWVRIEQSTTDRREKDLVLTAVGSQVAEQLHRETVAFFDGVCQTLGAQKTARLLQLLQEAGEVITKELALKSADVVQHIGE